MSAKHAPEQLMNLEQEGSEYILTSYGSINITEYDSFGEFVSDEKNAITTSRIVACVNACAGIPNEALNDLDSTLNKINVAIEINRAIALADDARLAAVTAQRDELLELLCLFFRSYVDSTQVTIDYETFERAERILSDYAKCEVQNGN